MSQARTHPQPATPECHQGWSGTSEQLPASVLGKAAETQGVGPRRPGGDLQSPSRGLVPHPLQPPAGEAAGEEPSAFLPLSL